MDGDDSGLARINVRIDSLAERSALAQALLRARASELGEVRRRNVRLVAGYGDGTTRDVMSDEADLAQLRWTMLDRLLAALDAADPDGGPDGGGGPDPRSDTDPGGGTDPGGATDR